MYLLIGLCFQYFFHYQGNLLGLLVYALFYSCLVYLTGILSKSSHSFVQGINWNVSVLLFLTSVLSKSFLVLAVSQRLIRDIIPFSLTFIISEISFIVGLVYIGIFSERRALISSILTNFNIFEKVRNCIKKNDENEDISEKIKEGEKVVLLFQNGMFNLTILWCCNTMEQIMSILIRKIENKNNDNKKLFLNEKGKIVSRPKQISILNFTFNRNEGDENDIWEIRNKIAHSNYTPKYEETEKSILFFRNFINDLDTIMKQWDLS